MKNCILLLACLFTANRISAQTLAEIRELAAKKHLADARESVERFLQDPANGRNAEAWFFKGYIYQQIALQDSLQIPLTEPGLVAFDAYKKCLELDVKNKWLAGEQYISFFKLYNLFFARAAEAYKQQHYSKAFDHFVHAGQVQQYIYRQKFSLRGFRFSAVDTALLLNTATCAFKAGRKNEGMVYYAKLADARIADPEYLPVYHALVDHFSTVRDEIAFHKYLRIGRDLFPYDQYWVEAEQGMYKSNGVNAALIRSFEEKIRQEPGKYETRFQFCNELYNMLFLNETKPAEAEHLQQKLEQQFEQALALQQTGVNTELLMARYFYNRARETQGLANEQQGENHSEKSRAEYTEQFSKARTFAQTVYQYYDNRANLKRNEIECFRVATNILAETAEWFNQPDEAQTFRAKLGDIAKMIPVRQ